MTKNTDRQGDNPGIDAVNALFAGTLLDDAGLPTDTMVVAGPPCSGKTSLAVQAVVRGIETFGDNAAVMTVSNRKTADRLADSIIRTLGASSQARPVTTLSAVAFRLIAAVRTRLNRPAPRLLNGAEQDTLLRRVVAVHVRHAMAGDDCATCRLLRDYFSVDDWSGMIVDSTASAGASDSGGRVDGDQQRRAATSETLFLRGIDDAFVVQLRDMLSRMNELGASPDREQEILGRVGADNARTARLRVQWRLAFALRTEYSQMIAEAYPGEHRLDSSRLLIEGTGAVGEASHDEIPQCIVVDDFQDLTLAGFAFLGALARHHVKVVVVGNPDESVQSFRGSFPEYLFAQMRSDPFHAAILHLDAAPTVPPQDRTAAQGQPSGHRDQAPDFHALVASRVSLSIQSTQDDMTPLPQRPGKLPWYEHALPISAVEETNATRHDGTVGRGLYRSANEEMDDVIWRIKQAHLSGDRSWNDLAVIAHDNASVRAFGERLRRDGVPVRYSSVTRPLKDEPFVQGLFALIELAQLRWHGFHGTPDTSLASTAAYIRSRVAALMGSPLITLDGHGRDDPARLSTVETAMKSLGALAGILHDTADAAPSPNFQALTQAWNHWRSQNLGAADSSAAVQVNDQLIDAHGNTDVPFGIEALYLLLAFGGSGDVGPEQIVEAIGAVTGSSPHARAFAQLWQVVDEVAQGLASLQHPEPQYALSLAWQACHVAERWQRTAMDNTDEGRAANDRLDAAMRLFDYAEGSGASRDITGFLDQVRSMRIEADSLAKVAPIDEAVTLTTPAGADGQHWPVVWVVAVQQGVWPNLTARNTMFGGEDLAQIMLHGQLDDDLTGPVHDASFLSVLCAEQKAFLVALTRASERVAISAVVNDDMTPSDFLYGYMPELFDRDRDTVGDTPAYTEVGGAGGQSGMDADPRGLVALARARLANEALAGKDMSNTATTSGSLNTPAALDAAEALALLAKEGIASADPENWAYTNWSDTGEASSPATVPRTPAAERPTPPVPADGQGPVVRLSPSAVDGLWGCPVCWLLENRFAGPTNGGVSQRFGMLIHRVAQLASEEGLDLPDDHATASMQERVEAVTARMMALYDQERGPADDDDEAFEQYQAMRNDADAERVLGNIAHYFVYSNTSDYLQQNADNFSVGRLERAQCEVSFAAVFGLQDILDAYQATPGVGPLTIDDLYGIMGVLVGGWPEGMRRDLRIQLSGRIDRLETRRLADGRACLRLIDYKTGKKPTATQFANDLQLICYQLWLQHDSTQRPPIAQSELFYMRDDPEPARSHAPEGLHQPALFVDGHVNNQPFSPRFYYRTAERVLDVPRLTDQPPQGVSRQAWGEFIGLRGTQAVWAMTMIARVWYAAAARRSNLLVAHPTASHRDHCRLLSVCPACAGRSDTIFDVREA